MTLLEPTLTAVQQVEISNYINALRLKHQAPAIIWDSKIYSFSQKWSSYLATNNLFQHSKSQDYGENLAYFRGYGTDIMVLLKLSSYFFAFVGNRTRGSSLEGRYVTITSQTQWGHSFFSELPESNR